MLAEIFRIQTGGRGISILSDKEIYKELLKQEGNEERADKLFLRHKARTDLFFLCSEILGWKDAGFGRKRRLDPILHKWLCDLLQSQYVHGRDSQEDLMILIPRLHLKTTIVKAKVVQNVVIDPMMRTALCGKSQTLMNTTMEDVKKLLSTPALVEIFDDILVDPKKGYTNWDKCTVDRITVKRDNYDMAHGDQITALTMGTRVAGLHFDWIFADDIVDPTNVTTPEQMRKVEEWWEYLQPLLDIHPYGLLTVTGTFYHYNDLYMKIRREKQIRRVYVRRALENGEPIYKSWFTKKDILKFKKRMSDYTFSCQFMLNPVPRGDRVFNPPYPIYSSSLPEEEYQFVITLDAAGSSKSYSDEYGMVVAAKNKANVVYILEAKGYKKKPNEILLLLFQKAVQYRPMRVGIESSHYEWIESLINEMKATYEAEHKIRVPLNIFPIPVPRGVSKRARIEGTLASFIRQQKCMIHDSCTDLMSEMDHFTGSGKEKDNIVDAASMVFATYENYSYNFWIKQLNQRGGMAGTFFELFKKKKNAGYTWRGEFKEAV